MDSGKHKIVLTARELVRLGAESYESQWRSRLSKAPYAHKLLGCWLLGILYLSHKTCSQSSQESQIFEIQIKVEVNTKISCDLKKVKAYMKMWLALAS